jgi:hypothetical protein
VSESVPSSEELLERLRALEPPRNPADDRSVMLIDPDRLRVDLEALAGAIAQTHALIRPPRDLPPALHRIPLLRLGPVRRLLLRAFEVLFRRQMLINEQIVAALEVERQLIHRIVQALCIRS